MKTMIFFLLSQAVSSSVYGAEGWPCKPMQAQLSFAFTCKNAFQEYDDAKTKEFMLKRGCACIAIYGPVVKYSLPNCKFTGYAMQKVIEEGLPLIDKCNL